MRIRYYSPAGLPTGYGKAATYSIRSLLAVGHEVRIRNVGGGAPSSWWPGGASLDTLRDAPGDDPAWPDAVIVHTPPVDSFKVAQGVRETFAAGSRKAPPIVIYTTWEGQSSPDYLRDAMWTHADDVWLPAIHLGADAPTKFWKSQQTSDGEWQKRNCMAAFVPHAWDGVPAAKPAISETYRFYFVGNTTVRKNAIGVIRAFAHAFLANDPVSLTLHLPGASVDWLVMAMASTGLEQSEFAPIKLSNELVRDTPILGDCFVSASRGEAWNLPAFEAMVAGCHVITPRLQGSDEFLTPTSAALYNASYAPAQVDAEIILNDRNQRAIRITGAQGLSARSRWLEPNLDDLVLRMREAAREKKAMTYGRSSASSTTMPGDLPFDPAKRYSYARVGQIMNSHLERLRS